ncbi:MAG: diguanylate cyclase [Candidatus Cloacimonas sp.]|nr:diguanylate cyclase [Candidatus Cloacimonadota bacterium]
MKIVVIDDDRDFVLAVTSIIKLHLPELFVSWALTGKEGIEIVENELPDIIMLDADLPDIKGLEVCKILKASEKTSHIPILAITGLGDQLSYKVKFMESGADAFLNKPFNSSELVSQVKVLLRIKEAEDVLRKERDSLVGKVSEQQVALQDQFERWELLIEHVAGAIWDFDFKANKTYFSPQWYESLGLTESDIEISVDGFKSLIHPFDKEKFQVELDQYFKKKKEDFHIEIRMRHGNGMFRWFEIFAHGIWDEQGVIKRLLGVQKDVTEQKKHMSHLESMALYDNLTRLANRYLFYDIAEKMLSESKQSSKMLGILFFDLDDFKEINDQFGHHIGDVVLKETARRLKVMMRPFDVLARIGGDEFIAAIYDMHSVEEFEKIKKRLLDNVNRPIDKNDLSLTVQASVGSSIYPNDADTLDELIKIADQNMYEDKKTKKAER